jgi:hypothetical protein
MKCVLFIISTACLWANCASRTALRPGDASSARAGQNAPAAVVANATPAPANVGDAGTKDTEREKIVPAEFRDVDFKNFSYRVGDGLGTVRLKDGHYEYENWEEKSSYTLYFEDADFADLTGDGKKEAIVRLNGVNASVSSDGGTALFYFYSPRRNRPRLFWKLDTGSQAYGCGLKSFVVERKIITLEVFRECRYRGETFARKPDPLEIGKYAARAYTRFEFAFDGRKFAQTRREVFPYSGNATGSPTISISHD